MDPRLRIFSEDSGTIKIFGYLTEKKISNVTIDINSISIPNEEIVGIRSKVRDNIYLGKKDIYVYGKVLEEKITNFSSDFQTSDIIPESNYLFRLNTENFSWIEYGGMKLNRSSIHGGLVNVLLLLHDVSTTSPSRFRLNIPGFKFMSASMSDDLRIYSGARSFSDQMRDSWGGDKDYSSIQNLPWEESARRLVVVPYTATSQAISYFRDMIMPHANGMSVVIMSNDRPLRCVNDAMFIQSINMRRIIRDSFSNYMRKISAWMGSGYKTISLPNFRELDRNYIDISSLNDIEVERRVDFEAPVTRRAAEREFTSTENVYYKVEGSVKIPKRQTCIVEDYDGSFYLAKASDIREPEYNVDDVIINQNRRNVYTKITPRKRTTGAILCHTS